MTPDDVKKIVQGELQEFLASDRYIFAKHVQFLDGRNIQVGRTTGTKIGTAADQKIGLYGTTPVVQASAISAPTGGVTVDTEARTAINTIRTVLQAFGLTA